MAIKDLQARQGNVNLEMEIVEKGDVREFEKFGKKGKVCNAVAKDDSGSIKLTLWNEDIDKVSVGDKVKIENGWVGEWQGELQLSTGKFGKLEVVGKGDSAEAAVTSDEKTETEVLSEKGTDHGEHILTEDEKTEEAEFEEKGKADSDEVVEEEIIEDADSEEKKA
jgi:replication factor A1